MSKSPPLASLPPGSDLVAAWARRQGLTHHHYPRDEWFRAWEPHDTLLSPEHYFNAVSWVLPGASATVVEPWYSASGCEPLERTLLLYLSHPGLTRRAAARGGEHFNTRTTFLLSAPPPRVRLGDPPWDEAMASFAASSSEAVAALPPRLRRLLASWRFAGHLELRPGGLILHVAARPPSVEGYQRFVEEAPHLVQALGGPA